MPLLVIPRSLPDPSLLDRSRNKMAEPGATTTAADYNQAQLKAAKKGKKEGKKEGNKGGVLELFTRCLNCFSSM